MKLKGGRGGSVRGKKINTRAMANSNDRRLVYVVKVKVVPTTIGLLFSMGGIFVILVGLKIAFEFVGFRIYCLLSSQRPKDFVSYF